jgi:DNA-binding NtrC family response regulator
MATPVLVVDDERSVRDFLRHWLEGWGYDVVQAESATEALQAMLVEPAPIMLCDIRMPGQDGLWLVDRVRDTWPTTAIIMATGVDDLQTVMKTQRAGVIDYVTKPFGWELLRQALKRAESALSKPISAK